MMQFKSTMLKTVGALSIGLLSMSFSAASHADTPKLSVGSDMTFPPYEFINNDKPAGFDIELMDKLAKNMGMQTNYTDTRFSNLIIGITSKKFPIVISGLYITPERLKQVDFVPYVKTGVSFLVKANAAFKPEKAADLCGKTVSVQKGTAFAQQLNGISADCTKAGSAAIKIREFETSPEAAQALLAGAADAQYDDAAVAQTTSEKLHGRVVVSSKEALFPVVMGIAVEKGNKDLVSKLNAALDQSKKDGSYAALLKKYNLFEPTAAEIAAALKS